MIVRSIAITTLLIATSVEAQHIDVLLWDAGGRVGVGEYDFDNAAPSDRRVQIGVLPGVDGPSPELAYTAESPGFIALDGADALPGNELLRWSFLPMTVDTGPHAGHRSTLLYWDGQSGSPEFGPTSTDDYEFSLTSVEGTSVLGFGAATGAAEAEPGNGALATTQPDGYIHQHPVFFLDDNGDGLNTTIPDQGIYVVAFQLQIADLEASDPVFMVWATPELSVLPALRPAALWVNARIDTLVVEQLEGDFNGDGFVDIADYTTWRDGLGAVYEPGDYDIWSANFGASAAAGSASSAAVPEPTSLLLIALAAVGARVRTLAVPSCGA